MDPRRNIVDSELELEKIVRAAKSVAVLGMKDETDGAAPAFLIPRRVKEAGLRIIPVNPSISASLGETSYSNLASVPHSFDMVNVFRRSENVPAHVLEILELPPQKRPKVVWMQTGVVNHDAAQKLAEAGITVVMDRCLAVYVSRYRHKK
jgi:uncharacterized protein